MRHGAICLGAKEQAAADVVSKWTIEHKNVVNLSRGGPDRRATVPQPTMPSKSKAEQVGCKAAEKRVPGCAVTMHTSQQVQLFTTKDK